MATIIPLVEILLLGIPLLLFLTRNLPPPQREQLRRIVLLGFGARLLVACIFDLVPQSRVFHEDANGYESAGKLVATAWLGEGPPVTLRDLGNPDRHSYPGFLVFCSTLFYVFGRYRLIVTAFTSLFGSVTVVYVYRLTALSFHHRVALRAAALTAFFPSMILWSAMALKDPLMIMLIVIALDSAIVLRQHLRVRELITVAVIFTAIWFVRFYIVYFLVLATIASLVIARGRSFVGAFYRQLAITVALAAFFSAIGLTKNLSSSLDEFDLAKLSSYRHGMAATAHSGFAQDADVSTTGGALAFLPLGMSVLLLGPLPWQMTSFRPLLTLPEMIAWWLMVPSVLRGIRFALRKRFGNTVPIVVFGLTLIIVYSLTLGNVGAAFRQRAQVFVFLFVFAAVGQFVSLCRQRKIEEDALTTTAES
jgi:hypothetical protein